MSASFMNFHHPIGKSVGWGYIVNAIFICFFCDCWDIAINGLLQISIAHSINLINFYPNYPYFCYV